MSAFEVRRRQAAAATGPADAAGRTTSVVLRRAAAREDILDAVRRWAATYGAPPTWVDWDPSRARRLGRTDLVARFEGGGWPTIGTVLTVFPTLGDAVSAAGLRRRATPRSKPPLLDRGSVLVAICDWTRRHGEPPAQTDLDPYRARRTGQEWRAVRYLAGDWPCLNTVRRHFGTLSVAISEAGLEARPLTETVDARAARRRRNRLALVEHAARTHGSRSGPPALGDAVRAVARARDARDADDLERALLDIAGVAVAWADRVGLERRRPADVNGDAAG